MQIQSPNCKTLNVTTVVNKTHHMIEEQNQPTEKEKVDLSDGYMGASETFFSALLMITNIIVE